jgi:hypothetical protein
MVKLFESLTTLYRVLVLLSLVIFVLAADQGPSLWVYRESLNRICACGGLGTALSNVLG